MANPYIHSKSSAKRYGGKPEDYLEIHKLLDGPKVVMHILEDFRMQFIPTPQDFLKHMTVEKWMQNGVKLIDNPEAIELANKLKENGRINQEMERA